MLFGFLTFSDAAKFADIAKIFLATGKYGQGFAFWGMNLTYPFSSVWTPPVMPFSIAAFFMIFGIGDFAVIATSFFYFLLTLVFVFLLSKKIFKDNLTAALSTIAVGFNYDLINYATNGASESPFIFEIVAATYFVSLRKKWAGIAAFVLLVLMYFTRPQAFIYIAGLILYWLLLNFRAKRAVIIFFGVLLVGFLVDNFVLSLFAGKYFLYSVAGRGIGAAAQISAGGSASDSLRSGVVVSSGMLTIAKKIFYNLYNFFKLLPQIMNPYLFGLFIIGIFKWGKDKTENSFKAATIFVIVVTFLVTAASIPFYRYLHPVVPFVYTISMATLVWIVGKIFSGKKSIIIISTLLILFFGVGQTLGIIFLDSRFERNIHNVGKAPVYVVLSQILNKNTSPNQIVITNLDTWGSWYGERKTVWFPIEPKQIIDPATDTIPFDAIYLTSYLIDDENYYMGSDWRLIFNNPNDSKKWTCEGCSEIAKEFKLKGVYVVSQGENYERQDAKAILLIKK